MTRLPLYALAVILAFMVLYQIARPWMVLGMPHAIVGHDADQAGAKEAGQTTKAPPASGASNMQKMHRSQVGALAPFSDLEVNLDDQPYDAQERQKQRRPS